MEGLLSLDPFLHLDEETSLTDPVSIKAGDFVHLVDGRQVQLPPWLKGHQPLCILAVTEEPLVDFSLPLETNIFYKNMERAIAGFSIGEAFAALDLSNVMLLASSGCGKTLVCHALAAKRFVIYLECQAGGQLPGAGCGRGYRMSRLHWLSSGLSTAEYVQHLFCCELSARLVVLVNLLRKHGAAVSPRRWLYYVQSSAGEACISRVFDDLVSSVGRVTVDVVQQLLFAVHELQARHGAAGDLSLAPVLFVDEVHLLTAMLDVQSTAGNTGNRIPVVDVVIRVAGLLNWGVVWSGQRAGLLAAIDRNPGMIVQMRGNRGLKTVGDFPYLEPKDVGLFLDAVLAHSASHGVRRRLCHHLQGRASTVTGFIALLLTPVQEKHGGDSLTMRGAGQEQLNDGILCDTLELFMETLVVERFQNEIQNLPVAYALTSQDLGYVWCRTMLQAYHSPPLSQSEYPSRWNVLTLTSKVHEIVYPGSVTAQVMYAFNFVLGEPALQEALRRIVVKDTSLVDKGIRSLLSEALTQTAWDSSVPIAVALALVSRQSTALHRLCASHVLFGRFASHRLVLTQVATAHSKKDQEEWFNKVTADPDDNTFSLLPGVPVKSIVLLSGTDAICAAVAPVGNVAGSSAGEVDQQQPAVPYEPSLSHPLPLEPQRSGKRKLDMDGLQPSATPQHPDRLVILHFCCGSGRGTGSVRAAKQFDQEAKCGPHFTRKRLGIAEGQHSELASAGLHCMPVLVEIPHGKPTVSDSYVLLTENNADALFSPAVIQMFKVKKRAV